MTARVLLLEALVTWRTRRARAKVTRGRAIVSALERASTSELAWRTRVLLRGHGRGQGDHGVAFGAEFATSGDLVTRKCTVVQATSLRRAPEDKEENL